jgi:outer membrane protein assembly factor BamB
MKYVASVLLFVLCAIPAAAQDWPQFRGGTAGGVSATAAPVAWSVKDNKNIAWTANLPGRGPASPIVVKNRVIVSASSGANQDRMHVLCFDNSSGKQLWERQFWATGRCYSHPQSANAAPTPASDGQRIFAFYSSNDLVCLDLEGNLLWYRGLTYDYPKAGNDVGMSASPLVIGNIVVVQVENQGDSFAAGLDTKTGETKWKIARDPLANWCSPIPLTDDKNRALVLLQSNKHLTAHVPETGEKVWEYKAECQGIPSAATAPGRIYLPAGGLTALNASPESAAANFAWDANKLGPGSASPIVHEDKVYTISRAPVLSCATTNDGTILWPLRLKGAFWATPVIAGNHLYAVNFEGICQVIKLSAEKGEVVANNEFGEAIQASPAVSGNALYFRSDKHLWKIAE